MHSLLRTFMETFESGIDDIIFSLGNPEEATKDRALHCHHIKRIIKLFFLDNI